MTSTFTFAFTPAFRVLGLPFGVMPATAAVEVGEGELLARFGFWRVRTELDNIAGTEVTGPYSVAKTIGPAHLSFADGGLTFATNTDRGLCLRFHAPVRCLDPTGRLRHPGLTVTVADIDGLAAAVTSAPPSPPRP
jgi:hypothetical protein